MFYKEEIKGAQIPLPKGKLELYKYYCIGRITNLEKTGRVYILDIYHNGTLNYRYCTDGQGYIYLNCTTGAWGHSTIRYLLDYARAESLDNITDERARSFFGSKDKNRTAEGLINKLAEDINYDKRRRIERAKQTKQERLIGMFPKELSEDVKEWADKKIFNNYIFVGKKIKGKRKGTCEACGKSFNVGDIKHKSSGVCPKCKRESVYYLERYKECIREKKRICVFYKTEDYRLHRWTDIYKSFPKGKKNYGYDDYWYSGVCFENQRCNFAYGQHHNWGYMVKKDWLTPTHCADSYVYKKGLNEAFGGEYEVLLSDKYMYNFLILYRDMKEYPQVEYLLKGGCVELAHSVRNLRTGDSFESVLGIDKKYVPMARKYNISFNTLLMIRELSKSEFVSEELLGKCLEKGISTYELKRMKDMFPKNATYGKLIRYIDKQKGNSTKVINTYADYKRMAKELKITLTKKYDIYPKDLQQEHDRLVEKINTIKNKKKNAAFKRGINKIYKSVPTEFKDGEFCVVLPKAIEDFSREGQNLKICVGTSWYAEKHARGDSFICFVRRAEEPEKSFVCCELDLNDYKIIQIHGYKNDVGGRLPSGTREFAEKYLREIKKFRKDIETKGAKIA